MATPPRGTGQGEGPKVTIVGGNEPDLESNPEEPRDEEEEPVDETPENPADERVASRGQGPKVTLADDGPELEPTPEDLDEPEARTLNLEASATLERKLEMDAASTSRTLELEAENRARTLELEADNARNLELAADLEAKRNAMSGQPTFTAGGQDLDLSKPAGEPDALSTQTKKDKKRVKKVNRTFDPLLIDSWYDFFYKSLSIFYPIYKPVDMAFKAYEKNQKMKDDAADAKEKAEAEAIAAPHKLPEGAGADGSAPKGNMPGARPGGAGIPGGAIPQGNPSQNTGLTGAEGQPETGNENLSSRSEVAHDEPRIDPARLEGIQRDHERQSDSGSSVEANGESGEPIKPQFQNDRDKDDAEFNEDLHQLQAEREAEARARAEEEKKKAEEPGDSGPAMPS